MKLRCNNCHHVFDEDDAGRYVERESLSGRATVEQTFLICPHCGDEDIEDLPRNYDEDE